MSNSPVRSPSSFSPKPPAPSVGSAARKSGNNVGNNAPNNTPGNAIKPPPGTPMLPDCVWPTPPKTLQEGLLANKLFLIFLLASLWLHGLMMLVRFTIELREFRERSSTIDVVLVNSFTREAPDKADVLAQFNLDGGGNTDEDRRIATPLPKLPEDSKENEPPAEKPEPQPPKPEKTVIAPMVVTAASQPTPIEVTPETSEREVTPDVSKLLDPRLPTRFNQLEAEIQKDNERYQKRPRKHFVGSRSEEYRFARYIEDWRLKVERIGNMNYPEAARREQIYGSLRMTVAINKDGTIHDIEINESSGHRILDAAAQKIVDMCAPFGEFPKNISQDTDILYITRTWSFTRGSGLETR